MYRSSHKGLFKYTTSLQSKEQAFLLNTNGLPRPTEPNSALKIIPKSRANFA
jgi:hypothetical protein